MPAVMGDTLRCSCRACSDCCGAKRGDGSSTGSSVAMRSLAFGSAGGGAGGALLLLVTPPASPPSAWAACSRAMVASASRNLATIVAWRNATRLNCATPPQPRSSHHTNCRARANGASRATYNGHGAAFGSQMGNTPLVGAQRSFVDGQEPGLCVSTQNKTVHTVTCAMASHPTCAQAASMASHTRAYQVLHQRIGSHVQQRAHNRDVALGGSHVQRRVTSLCRRHVDKRLSCPPCTVAEFRLTARTRNVEASTSAPCATRARRASSFPRHAASCNGV